MRVTSKRLIPISLILVLLIGSFFILKYFLPHLPYPSVDKQRAALNNKPFVTPFRVLDSAQIVDDLKFLSSDSCEGRGPGTNGHTLAMERIVIRMREARLDSFNSSLIQNFLGYPHYYSISGLTQYTKKGQNIIGWIKGTEYPEKYVVISAHYDHLGIREGKIYHGASDNASGTACLLAMAKYFKQHPLKYSLIFAAFDREESMMEGSKNFIANPPLDLSSIKFNLNIDMITRNDSNEIFACGVYHYPSLKYLVTETQNKTNSKLLMGHDKKNSDDPRYDWTGLSDHLPFYQKEIPFLYIGTEDHPDYHQPTDTWDKTNLITYIENCNMIVLIAQILKL